jgi:signal peptidase II
LSINLNLQFYIKLFVIFISVLIVDQYIKNIFVNGFEAQGKCISLVLTFNRGVAFSMFSWLGENLKWIQIALLISLTFYIFKYMTERNYIPAIIVLGAGISNIIDRFLHGGVVDYVYWHCWFDFAIFNLADVLIDIGVVWILILSFFSIPNENHGNKNS